MSRKTVVAASLSFCIGIAALSSSSFAADKGGAFAVRGPGAVSCEAMLKAQGQQLAAFDQQLADWTVGYVTAINRVTPGTYDALVVHQPGVLPNIVAAVCKANPKVTIESVVFSVLQRLKPAALAEASPLIVVKAGNAEVPIRKETLVRVQQDLGTLKLYKGRANGVFGPETEGALRAYQKSVSLQQTGLPDSATVIRLLVEQPPGSQSNTKVKRK